MPALKGSLTYARFYVEGELPDDFRERFFASIRENVLRPLEPEDEDPERTGFCRVGEPFELELAHEDVFYDAYLNLGVRTDRWVIPPSMLKAKLKEAEQAYLLKKGRERLTKKEKTEMKELLVKTLRKSLSPVTRMVDLSWSLEEGIVRFFSHAGRTQATMIELFQRAFGLKLVPESPYTLAVRLGLEAAGEAAWASLEPTVFGEAS